MMIWERQAAFYMLLSFAFLKDWEEPRDTRGISVQSTPFNANAALVCRGKMFGFLSLSFIRLFSSFSPSLPLFPSSPSLICPFHSHQSVSWCRYHSRASQIIHWVSHTHSWWKPFRWEVVHLSNTVYSRLNLLLIVIIINCVCIVVQCVVWPLLCAVSCSTIASR